MLLRVVILIAEEGCHIGHLAAAHEALQAQSHLSSVAHGLLGYGSRARIGREVAQLAVLVAHPGTVGEMALYHIGTRHHPAVHVLCIHAPDAHRGLEVIGVRLVGIASHVAAIVEAAAQTQAWDAPVIEARHVARAGEVVLLEDSVVGVGGPAVAVEAVGIEPGHHHGLVVKAGPPAAELSSHLCSGGMPGAGQYAGLALGAHGAEEEDGLMVRVRQAYGHYHVSHAHIESVVHVVSDVELFERDLASLFHLSLVLAVLRILDFVLGAHSSGLEFNLHAQCPVLVELVVACYHEARHGNGVAFYLAVAVAGALEAVDAIVLEGTHQFAVASYAVAVEAVILGAVGVPLRTCLYSR